MINDTVSKQFFIEHNNTALILLKPQTIGRNSLNKLLKFIVASHQASFSVQYEEFCADEMTAYRSGCKFCKYQVCKIKSCSAINHEVKAGTRR